ncbi:MAG: PIN domain-containing protein, partial [Mycobacteriales bacterium]
TGRPAAAASRAPQALRQGSAPQALCSQSLPAPPAPPAPIFGSGRVCRRAIPLAQRDHPAIEIDDDLLARARCAAGAKTTRATVVGALRQAAGQERDELIGTWYLRPVGALEQLFSARPARDCDGLAADLLATFEMVPAPPDVLARALQLQRDLAQHYGRWHRVAIPDLLIAETALHSGLGVVHLEGDYERIAKVRPLRARRLH